MGKWSSRVLSMGLLSVDGYTVRSAARTPNLSDGTPFRQKRKSHRSVTINNNRFNCDALNVDVDSVQRAAAMCLHPRCPLVECAQTQWPWSGKIISFPSHVGCK